MTQSDLPLRAVAAEGAGRGWNPVALALVLGLAHLAVDAASMAILTSSGASEPLGWDSACRLFLLYNALAFGLQLPLGLGCDALKVWRPAAVAGLAAVVLAIALAPHQQAAAAVAGLGNAVFHVGAGAIVLQQGRGRATLAGLFVGPGALGLWLGAHWGAAGFPWRALLAALVAAAALVAWLGRLRPAPMPDRTVRGGARRLPVAAVCVALLAVSVATRSLAGGMLREWWADRGAAIAAVLVLAAVAGKMLGGALADRLGWRLVSGAALAALAPLILPAPAHAAGAAAGMALVQLTMAVTLTAVYVAMPRHAGAAFGLSSLAVLVGDPWVLGRLFGFAPPPWLLVLLVMASAGMVLAALSLLGKAPRPSPII